jgi:hypothetical protein
MKLSRNRRREAFTRLELAVVSAGVILLGVIFLAGPFRRSIWTSRSICCNCNLKLIGTAYRLWAGDHANQFPAFAPQTNGGWSDYLSRTNAGTECWRNYAAIANDLGQSSKFLVCPSDQRTPAKVFVDFTNNLNLSYFVGVTANDTLPQSILGGDRNLGPGSIPDAQYGFSPVGAMGNDVLINGSVCWSSQMHLRGNPGSSGNIPFGDSSVQAVQSAHLAQLVKCALAESVLLDQGTNSSGIRLVFP